jgi:hypothetical protein
VTRELAQWVVDNDDTNCRWNQVSSKFCPQKLEEYQGEDSSMGIWMDEAPWTPNLVPDTRFVTHSGNCDDTSKFVIGHDISGGKMMACYHRTGSRRAQEVHMSPHLTVQPSVMWHRRLHGNGTGT